MRPKCCVAAKCRDVPQADVALAPFDVFHSTENRRRVSPELPSGTCRTPFF
jgi:hypothetical protein